MKYAYQTIRLGGYVETVLLAFASSAERRAFNARHPCAAVTRKQVPRGHLRALRAVGRFGYNDAVFCAIVGTSFEMIN
jgi:hypothetical protein